MGLAALFAATVSTGALAQAANAADQAQITAGGHAASAAETADGTFRILVDDRA